MTAEDNSNRDEDQHDDTSTEGSDDESPEGSDDERVKERGRYDADSPGVTDARPGRDDIGEGSMPSDYHEAVAKRPVEVKLPDTPDLSEEGGEDDEADGDPDERDKGPGERG